LSTDYNIMIPCSSSDLSSNACLYRLN